MRILTLDIGGTDIKYGIINESFDILEAHKTPTNAHLGGAHIIDTIIDISKNYTNIDKIAISTAGQVDSHSGVIVYATDTIPNYTGTRLKEAVEKETGILTVVENDVNSAAYGEAHFGAGKGYDSFICLTYGTGIGGAIFLNGDVFKGSGFSAGEMGHIITHAGGKACTCGGNGCYEQYASTSALLRAVNEISPTPLNSFEIFSKMNSDEKIKSAVDSWIDEIIIGLISIIYTFNPPLIILGGGIMNEEYIINSINERLPSRLMESFRNVKIKRATLGNKASMLGASYKAVNNM